MSSDAPSDSAANSDAVRQAFGAVVRERRHELGLTQEEVGSLHRNVVGSAERGLREPSLTLLFRYAAALQMDPAELVRRVAAQLPDSDRNALSR